MLDDKEKARLEKEQADIRAGKKVKEEKVSKTALALIEKNKEKAAKENADKDKVQLKEQLEPRIAKMLNGAPQPAVSGGRPIRGRGFKRFGPPQARNISAGK